MFKNFYANKQEDYFIIMGGSTIVNGATIETTDFTGTITNYAGDRVVCTNSSTATITGKNIKLEDIKQIKFTIDTTPVYISTTDINNGKNWETVSVEESKIVIKTKPGTNYVLSRKLQVKIGQTVTLKGTTETIAQGTEIKTYTSSYRLEEIDNLREYILKQGKKEILIKADTGEDWIGTSFIKDVLVGTAKQGEGEPKVKMPIIQMEMGGLCLKTLQSDIFNNWVNKEWVDGDNGIKAITDVAITDGKLNLDSLNIAQKVYNMLNRIAVSGGSYKDWIETVYTTDYYFRAETPVYEGGMSTIIDFEAVVSNSASAASGVEEPLGSLAGRGYNGQKKGGRIEIKINEPCYIMGIASITPLVDYSQGNDWDNWLETMDDLHKPQLDGIGYQDLIENKMHGLAKTNLAIGKQPAWLDYMTNFNKSFADFATGEKESYMVLNRVYNVNDEGHITNATTYINPKDYTYIFATNTETNRDFWVQIGCGVTARRVMSAAQIPLM